MEPETRRQMASLGSFLFLLGTFAVTFGPLLLPTRGFVLLTLGMIAVVVVHSPRSLLFDSRDILIALFIASLLGSALLTGASANLVLEVVRWVSLSVLAKLAVMIFSRQLVALVFSTQSIVLAGFILASNVVANQLSWVSKLALDSTFMHKNDSAAIIGLGVITLVACRSLWPRTRLREAFGVVALLMLTFTLFYLQSLAALGATAVSLASLVLWRLLRGCSPTKRSVGLGLVWSLPVLTTTLGQFLGVFEALGKRNDFSGRLDIWAFTLPDWSTHWLFGHPGGYWTLERQETFAGSSGFSVGASDNSFLDVFLNNGVFALITLIGLIGATLWKSASKLIRDPQELLWPTVSILFISTMSFFNSTLLSPMFFTLLMVLIYLSPVRKRRKLVPLV